MCTVRVATPEDLSGILKLYGQPDMDNGEVLDINKAMEIFNKMKGYPDYKVYVAENEDGIIGTFALAIMDNIAHLGSPSGLVEDVVVLGSMQGKGVGKKMMETAIEICKNKGCYKVSLSSNLKRVNAHKFYESIGYKRHGYSFLMELNKNVHHTDLLGDEH